MYLAAIGACLGFFFFFKIKDIIISWNKWILRLNANRLRNLENTQYHC